MIRKALKSVAAILVLTSFACQPVYGAAIASRTAKEQPAAAGVAEGLDILTLAPNPAQIRVIVMHRLVWTLLAVCSIISAACVSLAPRSQTASSHASAIEGAPARRWADTEVNGGKRGESSRDPRGPERSPLTGPSILSRRATG